MKYIILLSLIYLTVSLKSHLRQVFPHVVTELPQHIVKAGTFDNIAPDARNIITAQLAVPKADIKLNINHQAIAHTVELLAVTPVMQTKSVLDRATGHWFQENDLVNKNIIATTKNVANVNTYHSVKIDLTTGKAIKHYDESPKMKFGI